MNNCDYVKDSNKPCNNCPKLMTALYRCSLLQEIQKEAEEEDCITCACGEEISEGTVCIDCFNEMTFID